MRKSAETGGCRKKKPRTEAKEKKNQTRSCWLSGGGEGRGTKGGELPHESTTTMRERKDSLGNFSKKRQSSR